ncbi:hypothetical protein RHGRI_005160 [Rhododendron griersonianum]|uniref:Uncharacterized protein n=1 Tax=Rhododendron griersonianum TaxID=479676 RepID=A0AAV6LB71_9ERIC|nr:hypothetical protein RHGRI_005160 [Rhododendron griersonianum]
MFQIIILLLWLTTVESIAESSLARPGCQDRCGNIDIPYPFGIGSNCSFADGFAVTCKYSFDPPKPFIESINLEVLQISLNESTVQVYNPVITSNCSGRADGKDLNLSGTPFWFTDTYNSFTAMGCNNLALVFRGSDIKAGCMSICNDYLSPLLNKTAGCYGLNCCQTSIQGWRRFVNASLKSIDPNNSQDGCKYAFILDYQWFRVKDIFNVSETEYVPAVLNWELDWENVTTCNTSGSFCGDNAYCFDNATGPWNEPKCFCKKGYEGNPYLPRGCRDIDECSDPSLNRCVENCSNAPGGYNCFCSYGYLSVDYLYADDGTFSSLGALLLLICMWWLYREVSRRKEAKLKEKFFKRNGGLLLQQQLSSSDQGNLETTKLFTSKELDKATDNYNANRILGQGGQGTVYKGMLTDGRIGTFGYLDPEYFQSSLFTEKSDVYSFGVVLVELLTGKMPILSGKSNEGGSLTAYFLLTMKENRLYDILDARVAKEGGKEEILAFANIAKRCLYLNGSRRPTMKEVVMELDGIRMSNGATSTVKQSYDNFEYATEDDLTGPWEAASTSTGSFYRAMDIEPLLLDKSSSSLQNCRKREGEILEFKMFQIIFLLLWLTTAESVAEYHLAKPGCQERCGNIDIPYPFGIGSNCSIADGFTVTCNHSFNPPKPFIDNINLEVLQISLYESTVKVNNPVVTSNCTSRADSQFVDLRFTPFWFSDKYNRFTAMGCNNLVVVVRKSTILTGCMSICNANIVNSSNVGKACFGINCCQTGIPPSLRFINASLRSINPNNSTQAGCKYAFMVDYRWFSDKDIFNVRDMEYVPAVLDWGYNGTCNTNESFCGANAYCLYNYASSPRSSECFCSKGYEGNPYLSSGCRDIDECSDPSLNPCGSSICLNTPGGYYCYCPDGYYISADDYNLYVNDQGNLETTKLFTSKELEKATDNYNANRILGQGGQGTVYKGMLTDGRIVAIKKSKALDEGKLEQFINEVVILSRINIRNVVKLFGCCLETEVPMLVYEFIPNGTLSQCLHDQNEEFPLTWDLRLRIATEIAGTLFYLHSLASIAIYHRDIKSANILLDEKFRAKVSDFGISRSISVDNTRLTTAVQGTFGYLDPEYFQSSQFTEKSDVYSFGVVLVELLTRKKPILSDKSNEGGSLTAYFLLTMKENRLNDILDPRVVKEGGEKEILDVANIAKRCLYLNGSSRPTMKEVVMELDGIRMSNGATATDKKSCDNVDYATEDDLTGPR